MVPIRKGWLVNCSGISNRTLLGRALRAPLHLLPQEARVPIIQGRLRGFKWIAGSSNHGCWLGSYEYQIRRVFEKTVEHGTVVYDIGAHVGFYTLLASVLVGPGGRVIAFEPLPRNLCYLKAHLALNGVTNVSVVEAAVSDVNGEVCFDEGPGHSMAHIAAAGSLKVASVRLDEMIFASDVPPPSVLKVDVEGAEACVLSGALGVLSKYHPAVFVASHCRELHRECSVILRSLGYYLEPIPAVSREWPDEILAR